MQNCHDNFCAEAILQLMMFPSKRNFCWLKVAMTINILVGGIDCIKCWTLAQGSPLSSRPLVDIKSTSNSTYLKLISNLVHFQHNLTHECITMYPVLQTTNLKSLLTLPYLLLDKTPPSCQLYLLNISQMWTYFYIIITENHYNSSYKHLT